MTIYWKPFDAYLDWWHIAKKKYSKYFFGRDYENDYSFEIGKDNLYLSKVWK